MFATISVSSVEANTFCTSEGALSVAPVVPEIAAIFSAVYVLPCAVPSEEEEKGEMGVR